MKFIKYIATASLLVLGIVAANAQTAPVTFRVNYSANLPMGSFKDFVNKNSFRGADAEIMYHFNSNVSLGFATGFHDFYQKYPRDVYKTSDGSDVSAVLSYSIQTIPMMVKGQYNFLPGATVQPYVGVGVGGNLVSWRQYLGEFASNKSQFGFAAAPEAGFFVPFCKTSGAGFNLGATYNYMPFKYQGFDNLNSLGLNAGITIPLK